MAFQTGLLFHPLERRMADVARDLDLVVRVRRLPRQEDPSVVRHPPVETAPTDPDGNEHREHPDLRDPPHRPDQEPHRPAK